MGKHPTATTFIQPFSYYYQLNAYVFFGSIYFTVILLSQLFPPFLLILLLLLFPRLVALRRLALVGRKELLCMRLHLRFGWLCLCDGHAGCEQTNHGNSKILFHIIWG